MNKQFIVNAALNELELRGLFTKYKELKERYEEGDVLVREFLNGGHEISDRVDLLLNTHKFNVSIIQSMKIDCSEL